MTKLLSYYLNGLNEKLLKINLIKMIIDRNITNYHYCSFAFKKLI